MPCCAIITCRVNSKEANLNKGGISYHRFPSDLNQRQKWMDVTGRQEWIPTKTSTICSKHFVESDFCSTQHKRYLKQFAIPQLEIVCLRSVVNNDNVSTPSASPCCQGTSSNSPKRIASPTCSNYSTQKNHTLKEDIQLQTKESVIKQQRKQIKKLQAQTRRLKKKVKKLEDVLSELGTRKVFVT